MTQTSRQYIQRLQIIHAAQVVMIGVFSLIAYMSRPPLVEGKEILIYILAAILVAGIVASQIIAKILLAKAAAEPTLALKLTRYITATLVRLACLEVPGFFAAVVVLISGNVMAYIGSAGVLLMFFLFRPTPNLVIQELALGGDEKARMENPEGIIG
jgi:hypothetical protein